MPPFPAMDLINLIFFASGLMAGLLIGAIARGRHAS